ncbi:MAG TPA: hypothetical protein VG269_04060 [Tepidisphaeraceae bacterium]|nr:hypothetical protein [Tepidisphaeraceae bacterium]
MLALMIVSRNRIFDHWDWPIPLIVIFGINCVYALWSVVVLRRTAERARADAIEQMQEKRIRLQTGKEQNGKIRAKQLRLAIRAIRDIQKGAFAPLSKHPIIGAILIPASGAGALWLIEILTSQQ